jgi:cytochrome c551
MQWKIKILLYIIIIIWMGSCNRQKNNHHNTNRTLNDIQDLKTKQYAIAGKDLYELHCANCHQKDGTGLGRLIPPLAASDFMNEDIGRTVRIIRNGIQGEIIVNGIQYNQPMPGNSKLTLLEIAEITTYIYNIWGDRERMIDIRDVQQYLE